MFCRLFQACTSRKHRLKHGIPPSSRPLFTHIDTCHIKSSRQSGCSIHKEKRVITGATSLCFLSYLARFRRSQQTKAAEKKNLNAFQPHMNGPEEERSLLEKNARKNELIRKLSSISSDRLCSLPRWERRRRRRRTTGVLGCRTRAL